MRRILVLATALLGLLPSAVASALSFNVIGSEVFVDTYARAETSVQDRPVRTGPFLELDTAVAVFVAPGVSGAATSNALSERLPFLSSPRRLQTRTDLEVEARTRSTVESEADSVGGGELRVVILGSTAEAPAAGLLFNITLGAIGGDAVDWSFQYTVFNETLGQTLFSVNASDEGGTVPTSFAVPVGFGHTIRIEWLAEIYTFAANGTSSQGSLDVDTSIDVLPIPEPGLGILVLAGLTAIGAVRRPAPVSA